MDRGTNLGIPRASVEIGPGETCIGRTGAAAANWSARYVTGPAGRVPIHGLPKKFSCRVTINGQALLVTSIAAGAEIRPTTGPKWVRPEHALQTIIWVDGGKHDVVDVEPDYWSTTGDPTRFRAYIQDLDAGQLISGVGVTALRSGITAISDANGLFTLEVQASYRKSKTPPTAVETLVFSKSGYRRYEYRDLVLNPGLNPLEIYLERGTGVVVHKNRSCHNSATPDDEFLTFTGISQEAQNDKRGEIVSLHIEPSVYEGGWILCRRAGTKAVVKGRNLKSVAILWYSTGTEIGRMPPAKAGPMKKVNTSRTGDMWEIELPNLMTTDFWAQGIDAHGNVVKSMDLGNVGWLDDR
jgi:hypothetical protein